MKTYFTWKNSLSNIHEFEYFEIFKKKEIQSKNDIFKIFEFKFRLSP